MVNTNNFKNNCLNNRLSFKNKFHKVPLQLLQKYQKNAPYQILILKK